MPRDAIFIAPASLFAAEMTAAVGLPRHCAEGPFDSSWWRAIDHRQPYRWALIRRRRLLRRRHWPIPDFTRPEGRLMELVMAQVQGLQAISEAFTFDDVLLKPGLSD